MKILIALLATISISAFAAKPPSITGSDLIENGNARVISDGTSGGGGEDRNREVLSVQVIDAKGLDTSAKCNITNDKGSWSTTAPGSVTVLRSEGDLTIACSKDGENTQTLIVSAGTTQIEPKHFRFQADSDGSDDPVTVPYYNASIRLSLGAVR
jgi:hypothetical protein